MECRYDKMSCLSKGKHCRNCLLITHFSYDDNIRIFSHGISYCLIKSGNMLSNLFLMNEALIIFDNIFYWIFDGDNMLVLRLIQIVYHGNDCRRLSASSTTRHEDKSTIFTQKL